MPTKRKFTARFPTAKIKRIMQVDEDVGKISATVPSVVSCALETCIGQLVVKAYELALSRNSRTVTPSHLKHVIEEIQEFEFAQSLVSEIPALKPVKAPSSVDNGDCVGGECLPDSPTCLWVGGGGGLENTIAPPGEFPAVKKRGRPKKATVAPQCAQESVPTKKKRRRKSVSASSAAAAVAAAVLLQEQPIDLCRVVTSVPPQNTELQTGPDSSDSTTTID